MKTQVPKLEEKNDELKLLVILSLQFHPLLTIVNLILQKKSHLNGALSLQVI